MSEDTPTTGRRYYDPAHVVVTKGDPEKTFNLSGHLSGKAEYSFHAKVYDRPSENGIEGGRVSKLDLIWRGERVATYDRGWDRQPKRPEDQAALRQLVDGFATSPLVQVSPEPPTRAEYWAARATDNTACQSTNPFKFFDKSRYQDKERDR